MAGEERWKHTLIGNVLGLNPSSMEIEGFFKSRWAKFVMVKVHLKGKGLFVFHRWNRRRKHVGAEAAGVCVEVKVENNMFEEISIKYVNGRMLWKDLVDNAVEEASWILVGDFNIIKGPKQFMGGHFPKSVTTCFPGSFVHIQEPEISDRCSVSLHLKNEILVAVPSYEEVKKDFHELANGKSHGPDGFSTQFYKCNWYFIGNDLYKAVKKILSTGDYLVALNSTTITLVPKVEFPKGLFGSTRGLRQEDHISSYLFLLVLEDDMVIVASPTQQSLQVIQESLDTRHLRFGGRAQLIRSSIFGVLKFWCANLHIPKYVTQDVEKRIRTFLWAGRGEGHYHSKVSWRTLCLPLKEGGLGFKCAFCQVERGVSLGIEEKREGLLVLEEDTKVGNGEHVSFWHDPWSKVGDLWNFSDANERRYFHIPHDARLSEVGDWSLPGGRKQTARIVQVHQFLSSPVLTERANEWMWSDTGDKLSMKDKLCSWGMVVEPKCVLCGG
ncbi:hypothetical protein LIER_38312 [Lithospermum erythrorhizon]|uniref:Uncharacterized protein n=1 Tax=Lithospermum erythrorhizon TaxID=34254 RepID=A0AAV3PXU2_LITER